MDSSRTDSTIIADLKEHLKRLETRLIDFESHGKDSSIRETTGSHDAESIYRMLDEDNELLQHMQYLPQVRRCNFMEFKNRFCDEDARYAVDILYSGYMFEQEYMEEKRFRERLFEHAKNDPRAAKRRLQAHAKVTDKSDPSLSNDQSDHKWVRRIRIQAPCLLKILARIQGETWTNRPRTFDRPFCALIHFHPQFKEALTELEDKRTTQDNDQRSESSLSTIMTPETGEEQDQLDDNQNTLAILQAYIKFMDEEIIPETRRFENLTYPMQDKILFSDLCYLFKPGDFIYRQLDEEEAGGDVDHRFGERIWRVFFVNEPFRDLNFQSPDLREYSSYEQSEDNSSCFAVHAYHIEYTGAEFCVVPHVFNIAPYDGLKPVNKLPFHPIRIDEVNKSPVSSSMNIGDQVLQLVETKHAFYNDWTVTRTPVGKFACDSNGAILEHPEYINSEVMVDFQEAFNSCPHWRPKRTVLKVEPFNKRITTDDFAIRWWSGGNRMGLYRETRELIPQCTGVHHIRRNKFVLEDPFLISVDQNYQKGQLTTKEFLRWEEKVLIFCRVYAYVFQERKFAQLDVSRLTPSIRNYDALEALKIPHQTKKLIERSVGGHLLMKKSGGRRVEEALSLDVIRGKGAGLFILLHGVPGVGKTATAEAVAQANGKPLFKITCGDIGLTPDQVETSLRAIFRLASIWDCILLMDEVDTFFSQRSKGDSAITKNALVSVFLRVLDYYTGILFLTTNRSGALDEAFKSRIHYKIYYPQLSRDQTLDIWELNIQRLLQISEQTKDRLPLEIKANEILHFAAVHFDENANKRIGQWSGRQIRNAFQVAQSLAYYDALNEADLRTEIGPNDSPQPVVLDTKYFKVVRDITESFDEYMLEVFNGQSDADLAREMEHRADHILSPSTRSAREDYDFQYSGNNGTRSSFSRALQQGYFDQRRSVGQMESRMSFSGSGGTPQQYPPSSPSPAYMGYDNPRIDNRIPGNGQPGPGQISEGRTGEPFGGQYPFGRETHHQRDFKADQGYRMERN